MTSQGRECSLLPLTSRGSAVQYEAMSSVPDLPSAFDAIDQSASVVIITTFPSRYITPASLRVRAWSVRPRRRVPRRRQRIVQARCPLRNYAVTTADTMTTRPFLRLTDRPRSGDDAESGTSNSTTADVTSRTLAAALLRLVYKRHEYPRVQRCVSALE